MACGASSTCRSSSAAVASSPASSPSTPSSRKLGLIITTPTAPVDRRSFRAVVSPRAQADQHHMGRVIGGDRPLRVGDILNSDEGDGRSWVSARPKGTCPDTAQVESDRPESPGGQPASNRHPCSTRAHVVDQTRIEKQNAGSCINHLRRRLDAEQLVWSEPDGTLSNHLTVGGAADNGAGGLGQRHRAFSAREHISQPSDNQLECLRRGAGKYRLDIDQCFLTLDFPPVHDVALDRRLQIAR